MSQVIVVTESIRDRYNLDGLRAFGDVKFLYGENERKPSIYNATQFASSVAMRLSDVGYNSEHDYLALIGRQIEVGLMFYVLGLLVGNAKIIFFDASKAEYSESELRADDIPDLRTA
jgi:hypothetical protein